MATGWMQARDDFPFIKIKREKFDADSFIVISCVSPPQNEKLFPQSLDLDSKSSLVYQKYINSWQGSGDDIGLM